MPDPVAKGAVYVLKDIEFSTGSVIIEGIEGGYIFVRSLGIGGPNADKTFKFYTPEVFLSKYAKPTEVQLERLQIDLRQIVQDLNTKLGLLERYAQGAQSPPKLTPMQAESPFGAHPNRKGDGFVHPNKHY